MSRPCCCCDMRVILSHHTGVFQRRLPSDQVNAPGSQTYILYIGRSTPKCDRIIYISRLLGSSSCCEIDVGLFYLAPLAPGRIPRAFYNLIIIASTVSINLYYFGPFDTLRVASIQTGFGACSPSAPFKHNAPSILLSCASLFITRSLLLLF